MPGRKMKGLCKMQGNKKNLAVTEKQVDINSPKQLVDFASTVKQFVVEQNLFTDIKGKKYVNVEGWQFAGAILGLTPVVQKVEKLESSTEVKYRADVMLRKNTGENVEVLGFGVAVCSNKENSKKQFDEYAIASMAQTRAIGKAYRNSIGWLMKLAGYETTPAEEATGGTSSGNLDPVTLEKIQRSKTSKELSSILSKLSPEQKKAATTAVQERLEEMKDNDPA